MHQNGYSHARSTVLLLMEGDALGMELARLLSDDDCEAQLVSPHALSANLVPLLLPDVIVVSEKVSDAELLRLSRHMRGALPDQHFGLLLFAASRWSASGEIEPRDDHEVAIRLADEIRNWLRCLNELRAQHDVFAHNGLRLDKRKFLATLDGVELALTPMEFRLLWALVRRREQVCTREQLAEIGGGADPAARPRTIDVHIKSIRRKLGHRGDWIDTVRGVGYRFAGLSGPDDFHADAAGPQQLVHAGEP